MSDHDTASDPSAERRIEVPDGPEGKGAPSAESHLLVTKRDGVTRVDIADDSLVRPGPGPGQTEAGAD